SRSYGPGRYDPQYEWGGQDYPLGYVRWTENRNFDACLQLMQTGQLDLAPVTSRRAAFADAVSVYDALMQAGNADIGVVLEYAGSAGVSPAGVQTGTSAPHDSGRMPVLRETVALEPTSNLQVIGAGNFARTMLLPHLKGRLEADLIVNATGLSARHVKEKFGFAKAETDSARAFETRGGALMIGTRHHLHAPLVLKGLAADKQIFVEKPLCLTRDELSQVDEALKTSGGSVMVGFNRRFAPAARELKEVISSIPGARTLAYHVFAGPLAPDHWYANVAESGGRVLGEACHFFDFACFLLGEPVAVSAQTVGRQDVPDSVTAQIEFRDGSSAQVIYSAEGDFAFPKESFRVFASGMVAECENFQKLTLYRNRKRSTKAFGSKGHAEEMQAWGSQLKSGGPPALPYAEARQSMLLTFAVLDSLRLGRSVRLDIVS
ncbi:MAG TPA: Gfo/Idh/MocA family oxidoreductase, partial [Prosthecobacter sp.]